MTHNVLILGSGPAAIEAAKWSRASFDVIVAINNAWRVRPDWDYLIHPEDFPPKNRPNMAGSTQKIVQASDYVPHQNRYGGFIYAGGTMAFTAGYWALSALKPRVLAFFGCDMVYPKSGNTHFYGTGTADPLRADITLRDLEAKSARLMLMAAHTGCQCANLSGTETRLIFPRTTPEAPEPINHMVLLNHPAYQAVLAREESLGYFVASGRYWESGMALDTDEIDTLDAMWRKAHRAST
ncbi:MAG: hypothetical protein GDA36_13855 [Rhodobacteraceae bacterium]|nr:hypothetical protein [Paracoccaceae bacterium]